MMYFDTIIANGTVIDGTGAPRIKADIGIIGEKIAAIGDLSRAISEELIDATGKMISPGFIDVHVHSELELLGGIDQYAPLKMGVTTQLSSPDGFSWAILNKDKLKEVQEYLHVFYKDSRLKLTNDMTLNDFLTLFDGNIPSNLVLQVPHLSVRVEVMGWDNRSATDDELVKMELLVRDWMEAGAVSFCTGLEYEPMRHADTRELIQLSKVAAQYGGIYVAHQRGYGDNVEVGCQETYAIAKEANIPVHISHFTVDQQAETEINKGIEQHIDVTFDMYPYPAGCTHLLMGLPVHLQSGTPQEVKARLKDQKIRKEMTEHLTKTFPLDRVVFAAVGSEKPTGWEGKSLGQVMEQFGMNVTDTVCEILLETDLQALMIYHWLPERIPFLEKTFKHPLHMVATDGIYVGKRPHPRGFGSFAKVLDEYVRKNRWLTYEQAIYKMSGFPATRFNIKWRGMLKENYFADIVVFDPNLVSGPATFENARQDPKGIDYVFVNGKVAVEKGKATSNLNGKIVNTK
ncbi:amidohydrolase family protein [Pseudogracilibacillus auburnensis]|uniref:N-acyl-D-amino-acid deacylase n=1 Tax=Pseudogracilibacillus auburnensis TaxID=1494959 RepID=A0A2V3WNW4_9BACI|nr:amidohydrolase family protein [Pseudogracilibacillus auburnensis]PXW90399.1 N-acyl-D-amino-acid deacylase [Pseudogracilibacillus auburnensis]